MKYGGRRVPFFSGQVGHHRLLQGTRRRNLSSPLCPHHPEPPQVMRTAQSLSSSAATTWNEDLPHPMDHASGGNSKMYILFGPPALGLMTSQISLGHSQAGLPSPASMPMAEGTVGSRGA